MNDNEAFKVWGADQDGDVPLLEGPAYEAWQAACEYKHKEIDELLENEETLRNHMNSIGYRKLKKIQAENKQLKTENDILSGEVLTYKKMERETMHKWKNAYEEEAQDHANTSINLQKIISELEAENAKLRECVEFYADKNKSNSIFNPDYQNEEDCDFHEDTQFTHFGKYARQVLKEL